MPGLGSLGTLRLPPSLIDGERDPDDLSERYAPLDVDLSDDDGGIDRERSQKIEMADGSVIVFIGPRKIPKEDVEFGARPATSECRCVRHASASVCSVPALT